MRRLAILLAAWIAATPGLAANPSEQLDNPTLEARAREISRELRCVVCQNQSIDDSDADLAKDLRLLVRERLVAGDTDGEVVDYLVERYGAFVRLRPPLTSATVLLWGLPFLVVTVALFASALYLRRRRPAPADALSDAEEAALSAILRDAPRR
ncbi:cytochrome c-type biogenesis protein [Acuticoccus sp.]|uniref:cytochrome c-type biogenesis protein n=1 Tax=Acuticoccus sp. TaxID=1904378 RepID=UPI003B5164C7